MNVEKQKYYTYIVETCDGTLYTGYSDDPFKREKIHNSGKGAKYTKSRLPVKLLYYEEFEYKSDAMKREHVIKKLTRKQKWDMIYGK